MLSNREIQDLVDLPKVIVDKDPSLGYKEEGRHIRCHLDLLVESDHTSSFVVPVRHLAKFTVFIRQHTKFLENFSIGLRYQTGDKRLGTITLVRYNGPHGEFSLPVDGHFARPHIHRITASELASGSTEPQEHYREITDLYSTFEQALVVFFKDVAMSNYEEYFPELLQPRLFNGH